MKKNHNQKTRSQQLNGTILFLIITTIALLVLTTVFYFQEAETFGYSSTAKIFYPTSVISLTSSAVLFGIYYFMFYKDKIAVQSEVFSLALIAIAGLSMFVANFGSLMEAITAANNPPAEYSKQLVLSALPGFIEPIVLAIAFGAFAKSVYTSKPSKYAFCIGIAFGIVPRFKELFEGIAELSLRYDPTDLFPFFYILGRISLYLLIFAFFRTKQFKK